MSKPFGQHQGEQQKSAAVARSGGDGVVVTD